MRRRRTKRFRREASSVPVARTWLEDQLSRMLPGPFDDVVDDAVLGLSEIATNAVEHGAGRHFRVACIVRTARLTIEALDGGKSGSLPTARRLPTALEETGRGLFIVDHISGGDWQCDILSAGRMRVRFHLKLGECLDAGSSLRADPPITEHGRF